MSEIDAAASFLDPPSNGDEDDEIDSLPSEPDSDDVSEDYSETDAEKEWKESLQQLELLLTMVIVPYMGKYFGRKFAYWGMFLRERATCGRLIRYRMEAIHGVEIPCRDCGHEQGGIQRIWRHRSSRPIMKSAELRFTQNNQREITQHGRDGASSCNVSINIQACLGARRFLA